MSCLPNDGRPTLRGMLVMCASLLLVTNQAGRRCDASEAFRWSSSLEAASGGTGQHEKPLLVVDLAGEVTAEPFTSPMGRLLAATTFDDPRIIELSRTRFDIVCRQHGATPLVKRQMSKRAKEEAEFGRWDNVVFYFCTPDARVLHLAIGFLPADELLAAASLAERLLRETQLEPDSVPQMQAVRGWHTSCADRHHLLAFQRLCAANHEERGSDGKPDSKIVRHVVAAATSVHRQELKIRLASHWQGAGLQQTIAKLGHHGEVATSFPHLVLSEVPLVPLDVLDRICYEAVTAQPFLALSARRKALYGWFLRSRRERRPIVLVVDDQPFSAPPVNELAKLLIWQPKSTDVQQQLARFAAVQVTPGELAALIQDAALAPITLSRKARNWVLYDGAGTLVDVVSIEHGTRLLEAMKMTSE